jgi:L-ascorbate metabolism protein UlaG (beta-lactamase superfamily)
MKITKYPQSCILIETKGKKILIDPGNYVYEETDITPDNWKDIDFLLITHRHHDHCMPEAIKVIKKNNPRINILGNSEVGDVLKEAGVGVEIVKVGDVQEFENIKIEVVKAVHGYWFEMKDKGFPKENNGFIINDGDLKVYHCGDTISFYNEFKVDVVLVPICGHGVVMEPDIAVAFCQEINPKLVIPIHYESKKHPLGTDKFEEEIKKSGLNYKILGNSESVEINK